MLDGSHVLIAVVDPDYDCVLYICMVVWMPYDDRSCIMSRSYGHGSPLKIFPYHPGFACPNQLSLVINFLPY